MVRSHRRGDSPGRELRHQGDRWLRLTVSEEGSRQGTAACFAVDLTQFGAVCVAAPNRLAAGAGLVDGEGKAGTRARSARSAGEGRPSRTSSSR
jgi:hypothetical protein